MFGSLKRSAHLDFKLTSIDGIKYNIEQRYEAMMECDRGEEVSNARLANYFKEEGIKGTEDKLNLSNNGFDYIAAMGLKAAARPEDSFLFAASEMEPKAATNLFDVLFLA